MSAKTYLTLVLTVRQVGQSKVSDPINWCTAAVNLFGLVPLSLAYRIHRKSTLSPTLFVAASGLIAWSAIAILDPRLTERSAYVALAFTGAVAVSLFGARRPIVRPWIWVTVGYLAVMLWPILETNLLESGLALGVLRRGFAIAGALVLVFNYLPTRLWPGAVVLLFGCSYLSLRLIGWSEWDGIRPWVYASPGIAAWAATLAVCTRRLPESDVARHWLEFRDSYGLAWSWRVMEQYNRCVENQEGATGAQLGWTGPTILDEASHEATRSRLSQLTKRFRWE